MKLFTLVCLEENKEVYDQVFEQQRKRVKLVDTQPVEIDDDDEDDDGAERKKNFDSNFDIY
jgi:hypothetical protein